MHVCLVAALRWQLRLDCANYVLPSFQPSAYVLHVTRGRDEEGTGITKRGKEQVRLLPMHAAWFASHSTILSSFTNLTSTTHAKTHLQAPPPLATTSGTTSYHDLVVGYQPKLARLGTKANQDDEASTHGMRLNTSTHAVHANL